MSRLKKLIYSIVFLVTVFTAAQTTVKAQIIQLDYDFRGGNLGWTGDFADYSPQNNPPDNSIYELASGIRYLPRKLTFVPKRGFFLQGHNRSDDLFMFLKRRLTATDGIIAGQTYRIEYNMALASNAPSGCGGVGGAPGESVYLKVGASSIEPLAVLQPDGSLRMNVDKGNQSQGGTAASVAGNIANGIPCSQAFPYFPFRSFQRVHTHTTNVAANSNGELWLLAGTDSGYEGLTRLYYQRISVKLTPV